MIKKIGDLLKEYLADKGWTSGDSFSPIVLTWVTIAGDELGEHTRPVEIERGVLMVEADHPGWMQAISLRKSALLEAVNTASPTAGIRDLRVRLRRSKS